LAAIWISAADRGAVTTASHTIDQQLRVDPLTVGESRENDRRILMEAPLGVLFRVLPDERIVQVLTVWQFD
jgi:hypothetical protein